MQIKIWWPILFVSGIFTASILVFPSDLRLADLLGKYGRRLEAIATYERLLEQQPERDDIRLRISKLYIQNGDYEKAVAQVEQIDDDFLQDVNTLNQIADIYSQLGDKSGAILTLERIVGLEPDDQNNRRKLADAYEWNNDTDKALAIYEELITDNPNDTLTLDKLVTLSLADRELVKAKLYLRRYLSQRPAELKSRELLGDVYLATGQKNLATIEYERVLKANPDNNPLRYRLAELYLWVENYDQGIAHYEYLFLHNPLNHKYFNKLIVLTEQTDPEKAINYLRYRLNVSPEQEQLRERLYDLYVYSGCTDEAVEELKRTIARNPDEPAWLAELAYFYQDMIQPEQAAEVFQKLLKYELYSEEAANYLRNFYNDNKYPEGLVNLYEELKEHSALDSASTGAYAKLLVRMGRYGDAIDEYRDLLDDYPADLPGRIHLANLYLHTNNKKQAVNLIKNGQEKYHPANKRYLLYAAGFFKKQGLYNESLISYERLAGLTAKLKQYATPLVALYIKTGKYDKAFGLYDELLANEPQNLDLKFAKADIFWRRHDFDGMHEYVWQISKQQPAPPGLHARIGEFYFSRSFYTAAVQSYERAQQTASLDSISMQHLALALAWSNQTGKARQAFLNYHQKFPNDFLSRYQYGVLLAGSGEEKQAEQEFKIALKLTRILPDDRQTLEVRAGIHANRGNYEKSVRLYRALIARYPEDLNTYLNYAEGLLTLKDYKEAEKWQNRVLNEHPDNYRALRLQGRGYFEQRKYKQAAQTMLTLLQYEPGEINLQLDLSEAQLSSGDWSAGMKTLRKINAMAPNHAQARQRLQELRRQHAEAFAFEFRNEKQSGSFLKRLSKFSFTKALSSLFGVELSATQEDYSSNIAGFPDRQYRSFGGEISSHWGPDIQTRFSGRARRLNDNWNAAGAGAFFWRFSSIGALNLTAALNALWNDPLVASFFDGSMTRLQADLNLTLVKNIVFWNRISYQRHSLENKHFGNALQTYTQMGYRWGLKPYLLTYYQFYNLSYQFGNAANSAFISIPEKESIHYLGAAVNHQLTRRVYYQLGGSFGYNTRLNTTQYFGNLHLEYTLFRNLRLRSDIAFGKQNTLTGNDNYRSISVDFYYFY